MELFAGIMIPFAGTALGAACVFFLKHEMKPLVQRSLLGFASGVMVAAAVWSLLIPAMDMSEAMGKFAFIPGAVGFLLGILFLLGMDKLIPHLHIGASQPEGKKSSLKKTTMLVLAVTLHNIPEGMAVGVVLPVCWQKIQKLPWREPWLCPWESLSKTFRRGPLYPCRFGVKKVWERGKHFSTGRFPVRWSL